MRKIYHLGTCSTNQKILKQLKPGKEFVLQDIKTEKITAPQLEAMQQLSGSYEALFSRKALKYRSMKLGETTLDENDYRQLILSEYTFLKRPVIIIGRKIFIGSAPTVVKACAAAMQ